MKNIKIYVNENNGFADITIVFPKSIDADHCSATLVHDRGSGVITNMFGQKLERYAYHCANAYGDSGHASMTDGFSKIELGTKYKIVKVKEGRK